MAFQGPFQADGVFQAPTSMIVRPLKVTIQLLMRSLHLFLSQETMSGIYAESLQRSGTSDAVKGFGKLPSLWTMFF